MSLRLNKDIGIIGCEPYINGIANLLELLNEEELKRVKIFNGDARKIISKLKANSISKIFILFPDPWPKKKHYKRRFIQSNIIQKLYKILKKNGELRVSTDHNDYLSWILHQFLKFNNFYWSANSRLSFLSKPGNTCYFLQYYKRDKNN